MIPETSNHSLRRKGQFSACKGRCKDLLREKSLAIQMGPNSHHKCPCQRAEKAQDSDEKATSESNKYWSDNVYTLRSASSYQTLKRGKDQTESSKGHTANPWASAHHPDVNHTTERTHHQPLGFCSSPWCKPHCQPWASAHQPDVESHGQTTPVFCLSPWFESLAPRTMQE